MNAECSAEFFCVRYRHAGEVYATVVSATDVEAARLVFSRQNPGVEIVEVLE